MAHEPTYLMRISVTKQSDWNDVIETIAKSTKDWDVEDLKRLLNDEIDGLTTLNFEPNSYRTLLKVGIALSSVKCRVIVEHLWSNNLDQDEKAED